MESFEENLKELLVLIASDPFLYFIIMKSVEGVVQEQVEHCKHLLASPLRCHVSHSMDRRECHSV